jgi:hypothetical protein
MIRHWKPILACVLRIRGALRERLGPPEPATGGRWTIGELHLMASLVLAVPAYQLMKRGAGSPPRPLHPILSSLFRITDGIRMTTHDMMFSVTRPHRADEPLSAAQLYDHAEINATLIGDTGVCAGPRALIEEFLATAVDGIAPRGLEGVLLPDEVTATLDELPRALEYGLHGMQTWPTSAVLALAISRCHEAIMAIVEPASGHPAAGVLIGRLRHGRQILDRLQLAIEAHRDVHFEVYVDSYERSWRALREPVGPPRLTDALAPVPEGPAHRRAAERLTAAFASHGELADALGSNAIERIVTVLVALLRSQQAVLGATAAIQKAINAVLDRPRPARPLTTRDLLAFYALTSDPGQFPDPLASVGEELGFRIEITASTITIV